MYAIREDNTQLETKLDPTLTMVIYYGEDRWTRPCYLKDVMSILDEYQQYINDWNGHIMDITDLNVENEDDVIEILLH